ncbi:cadherin-like domain-containing protein [Microvirga aerilata]|uniref:Cadherin-like domain-containing protein n=1 Tax=Microvirga aerilata TaxID=670292 RepID=A0A936ZDV6_9HYPH|nr:Ig-like domain-containing protein [Microvirga aerilata]MBL0402999.1 cadherin-like domain-containing protein [Microvirga aerilata]
MDETTALAALHEALATPGADPETGKPHYVNAILAVLDTYEAIFLEGETFGPLFTELLEGGERQQAVAQGLYDEWTLSGNFGSVGILKFTLGQQISFEHAKHQFITAANSAGDEAAMAQAISAHLDTLYTHRQDQIARLIGLGDDPAVRARLQQLEDDPYTIVLNKIVGRLTDTGFLADLAAGLLAARRAIEGDVKEFAEIIPVIAALDQASDASDATLLAAFNDAADWSAVLAAIDDNGSTVLDASSAAILQILPDGGEREEAIGRGINEIRDLFGNFGTVGAVREAVLQQIAVEHAKHMFFEAINTAGDASSMAQALGEVATLSLHRQAQIELWSNSTDPEVVARVEALKAAAYTRVLNEIHARLDDAAFVESLSARLLAVRDATHAEKKFQGILQIIDAIDAAADAIDSPTAPATRHLTTNEDTPLVGIDIGASDPNEDALTYRIKEDAGPQKGTVAIVDGKFTYTPNRNVSGTDRFTFEISDGKHGTIEQKVHIAVGAVNDAPIELSLSKAQVRENAKVGTEIGRLAGSDAEGDPLTFTLLDDAEGRFEIKGIDGSASLVVKDGVKLDHEQAAWHRIRVQVKDAANATYEETLSIEVTDDKDEILTGTSASDVLNGDVGSDQLWGGLGNDTLTGAKGKDVFVFDTKANKSTNRDKIVDFSVKDDAIWLDNKVFAKLGKTGSEMKPAQLKKDFFTIGAKAKDKNDYLVYDKAKGVLFYDADGSGKGKAVEIASLSKKLPMTYKDFFVI